MAEEAYEPENDENKPLPEEDAEINETDIVFDCPHCSHSLCIDYRGAGLQINCAECGKPVLVPIPDGMNISDLDLEPGEILKQLFATRRNLQKAEAQAAEFAQKLLALDAHVKEMLTILRGEAPAPAEEQAQA
jgi:ribosomal protein S27E